LTRYCVDFSRFIVLFCALFVFFARAICAETAFLAGYALRLPTRRARNALFGARHSG